MPFIVVVWVIHGILTFSFIIISIIIIIYVLSNLIVFFVQVQFIIPLLHVHTYLYVQLRTTVTLVI